MLQQQTNKKQDSQLSNEIRELSQFFSIAALNDKVNQEFSDCFVVTILPQFQIKIIVNKDYPISRPKLYALEHVQHYLIDDSTWQIKLERKDTLKNLVLELKTIFEQSPPQQDPYIDALTNVKTKIKEDQLIQRIQQVDLKTLFKDVPVVEYKKIVEGGRIMQYIEKLPDYKELTQYIIELGKTNENFADHLIEQDKKIKHQKAELINLAAYFDKLKFDVINKERECHEVQNRLDPYHIVRQLDEQLNQLDELSNDKIEDLNGSTVIITEKFEDELTSYYNLRKQHHKLLIKKEKLEENLLLQKQMQIKQN